MNSEGSVEMVIALLARKCGLLLPEIFFTFVAMAIFTTTLFSFILKRELGKNFSIMNT